jgi:hypothetical protein
VRAGRLRASLDGEDALAQERATLEKLFAAQKNNTADPPQTFRFAAQPNAGSDAAAPKAVVDDVAQGMEELVDVGRRSSGLLILLAEICVGGLLSPVGLASIALFALLYTSGEFGTVSFVAQAPSAIEGRYYQPINPETSFPEAADDDDDATWARLRGGGYAHAAPTLRQRTAAPRCHAAGTLDTRQLAPPVPVPWASQRAVFSRHRPAKLVAGKEGDPSKCPFLGGPNGGGLGDANILTGLVFVATALTQCTNLSRHAVLSTTNDGTVLSAN